MNIEKRNNTASQTYLVSIYRNIFKPPITNTIQITIRLYRNENSLWVGRYAKKKCCKNTKCILNSQSISDRYLDGLSNICKFIFHFAPIRNPRGVDRQLVFGQNDYVLIISRQNIWDTYQ